MLKVWLCLPLIIFGSALAQGPRCDFHNKDRTYICKNIKDTFPSLFYGNYHLQCEHCDIRVFSSKTFSHENSLISFNVSDSGIKYLTQSAFSNLGNIQYLYLQNNRITNISKDAFAGLKQVYQINLDNNQIAELLVGFLNDLESNMVSLANNNIDELPNNVFEGVLNLLTLNIQNNNIKKIHKDTFAGLDTLEYLELQNNHICHLPLGVFKSLRSLRVLNLSGNKLSRLSLGTFSGLYELNGLMLANNTIQVFDGIELLPLSHLTNLDISGNSIYYLDAHSIYSSAPSLTFLRMEDNLFSCPLLMNVIKYLKGRGVNTVSDRGRYDVQNINGVACIEDAIVEPIPFDFYLKKLKEESRPNLNTC